MKRSNVYTKAMLVVGILTCLMSASVDAWTLADTSKIFVLQAKLTAPNNTQGGQFGYSVAVDHDGGTVVVGQPGFGSSSQGRALVYTLNGNTWEFSSSLENDNFTGAGSSVSYALGNAPTILVGAPRTNSDVGAVGLWQNTGSGWAIVDTLEDASGSANAGARLGASVALSAGGATAVVGAPGSTSDSGAILFFVYASGPGQWSYWNKWRAPGSGSSRQGVSVAAGGSFANNTGFALVGGPGYTTNSGGAWVWWDDNSPIWKQPGVNFLTGASGERAGTSMALSPNGGHVAVGGVADATHTGAVWVYGQSGNQWIRVGGKITAESNGSGLGRSVAIGQYGSILLAGEPGSGGDISQTACNAGKVRVWKRYGNTWKEMDALIDADASANACMGRAIALSGNGKTLVVAGPWDHGSGSVWIYTANERPPTPPNAVLRFDGGNNLPAPTPVSTDWSSGSYKAACPVIQEVIGISSPLNGMGMWGYGTRDLYCGAGANSMADSTALSCRNVPIPLNQSMILDPKVSNWDPANAVGVCGANEFVAGVSQSPRGPGYASTLDFQSILCCSSPNVNHPHVNMNPVSFPTYPGSVGEPGSPSNWSSAYSLTCGPGRYVIGLSHEYGNRGGQASNQFFSKNVKSILCAGTPLPSSSK